MKSTKVNKNNNQGGANIVDAIDMLCKMRDIPREQVMNMLENSSKSAYVRYMKLKNITVSAASLAVAITREKGVQIFARKVVSEDIEDDFKQITFTEAQKLNPGCQMGDIIEVDVTPKDFGRSAAQVAKQTLTNDLRSIERGKIYDEYAEKENEILTAVVERVEEDNVYVELGRTKGVLEKSEFMPGEEYRVGDHIKVYVLYVSRSARDRDRAPLVTVSRIHTNLVKRLFELEVPEIQSGLVEIKSIAREAGSRTKMAVSSSQASIDPVGACVGPRGNRVDKVVAELKNEKIDIIKWSADSAEYVSNALNPAHVLQIFESKEEKICRVIVPDSQLSLAIGKEGQNARLAAKLTGWKIDIKSQSQYEELTRQPAKEIQMGTGSVIADSEEEGSYFTQTDNDIE